MTEAVSKNLLFFLGTYFIFCSGLFAQKMSGQWMEAENNPSAPVKFANDANASNGKITWGTRWYRLAQVPLPMNRKPVYVYINAKTTDNKNQYFSLRIGKKNCGKVYLSTNNKWCWAKLGPVKYSGNPVSISPNGFPGINNYLDGFIISSNPKLTDEQLEKIKHMPRNGIVAIGKCLYPPTIDGKLNDACWKQTVSITPFLLSQSTVLAKEQTRAYMTYDNKNMYIGLKCYAKVLDPIENRLHEFADKIKNNDSPAIYKDDCIILLFAPDSKNCYDLTINANGAITDAKCKGPDYWESRDLTWSSGAMARGSRQNGFWTLEITIPRTIFGENKFSDLKFMVGRINQAVKENSAFGKVATGFHDSSSFSLLSFREAVSGIELDKFPPFNTGTNNLSVNINGGKIGILSIKQLICSSGNPPQLFTQEVSLAKQRTIEAPFKISGGKSKYRITLRDATNSDILLETPEYSFTPLVLGVKAAIKSPEKYDFFVNGETSNTKLNHGINVLALKAGKGTKAEITVGSAVFNLDSTWKFSPSAEEKWNTVYGDTAKWQKAPVKDGILQQNGYLRKILFVDATELWPNWKEHGVNICRGSSQQFFFPPRGLEGIKKAIDFKMNIELPENFELLGASSYYKLFKVSVNKTGTAKHNGIIYNRYRISLPQNKTYLKKLPSSHKYCMFAVRAPHSFKGSADMYYYASADNSYIEEIPQKLKINLLPELKGKQPRKIIFQLWTGWFGRLSDHELQRKIVPDFKNAGFNEIQKLDIATPEINNFTLIGFESWNLNFSPFVKKHPDMALIDSKGTKSTRFACPTALLNTTEGQKYFNEIIGEWLKKRQVAHVDWDYEASPFSSHIACYCPRCLKAFGNGSLAPDQIKNEYGKKWVGFMTGRMADLAGRIRNALRKTDPEIVFSVYSGYQSERTKSIYGVDWSKLKGKIDIAMCGYGRSQQCLEATYKAVGNTKLILGTIARPYQYNDRSYPSACSAAILMRRLLDSKGGGVLVYSLGNLDGRTLLAMSRVSSLAAEYEDFFIKGKRYGTAVKCTGEYAVLQRDKQKLLILLNQSSKVRKIKALFKNPVKVLDFYANKKLPDTKNLSTNILPGEIKAYLLK